MADVRAALTDAGYAGVSTYVQTGNIIVTSARPAKTVGADVEAALEAALGLDVAAAVRSDRQLTAIIAANPFVARGVDTASLHVGYCVRKPSAAAARALAGREFGRDQFVLHGSELYLMYPDGLGRSKMTGAIFERVLEVPITVRNWNVTTAVTALAASAQSGRSGENAAGS